MKLERSKNAVRNIKVGIISNAVNLLLPFLARAVFIRTLGAEYLGVNSLFSSVLSVLSLTELGFSSAVVFSMYKAIAEDDTKSINALLCFYRKVYRYVGAIILGLGLLLIPFLPNLTRGSYPGDIDPLIVYLVFLFNTVISYFLFAYLNSLLTAFQRTDIDARINMLMNIGKNALQIVLLLTVKNYYAYLAIMPVFTVLSNIRTAMITKKMFPQYHPTGVLSREIKADIKEKVSGLMIQKVCGVSRNSLDSIFVSMFLGLTQIAVYNNYYLIISAVTGFMLVAATAVTAGAGNSVAMEGQQKNHDDMMRMNFIYMWLSGWFTACLLCLYQPFMRFWAGPELLLPMPSVALFCTYFYVLKMGDMITVYVDAKGLWWHNRYRALVESGANIVLNYVLGKYFGVNGIISATLISLFLINFCYGSTLIYRNYFTEMKAGDYFGFHARCALTTVVVCSATYLICKNLPDTFAFVFARMGICTLAPNVLFYFLYRNTAMYRTSVPWILKRIGISKSHLFRHLFGKD